MISLSYFAFSEEGLVDCWADKRIACHARSRKSQGMKRISAVGSAWSACQRFIEGKPPIHHYRCWAIIQGLFESFGRTPVKVPKKSNHVRCRLCGLRWPFFVQLMKGDRQAIVVLTSPTICPPSSSTVVTATAPDRVKAPKYSALKGRLTKEKRQSTPSRSFKDSAIDAIAGGSRHRTTAEIRH